MFFLDSMGSQEVEGKICSLSFSHSQYEYCSTLPTFVHKGELVRPKRAHLFVLSTIHLTFTGHLLSGSSRLSLRNRDELGSSLCSLEFTICLRTTDK